MASATTNETFDQLRADFLESRKGALSLPITGAINYSIAAGLSLVVPASLHNLVLTICFWMIMPVAALIGRLRHEDFTGDPANPLYALGKWARVMVLLTWFIHIPVWIHAPDLFPLTVGIAFCLHWIVFGWSIGYPPLGVTHALIRCLLVTAAWHLVPSNRMGAVAAAVALAYAVSVWQLAQLERHRLAGCEMKRRTAHPTTPGELLD